MALLSAKFKQDESDMKINRIFEKIIVVLAFMQILSPIITSFFCLIGIEMDVLNMMLLVMISYILVSILSFSFNISFMSWKKPALFKILGWCLIGWIILVALVTGAINYTFIFYTCYIACFCMFVKIDKKYYKSMIYAFVIQLTVCSIMGLLDPGNSFMPGFSNRSFPMSLQFMNSNYASYVLAFAVMFCVYILVNYKKLWEQVVFWICYVILVFIMFLNGCYSAEFAIFIGMLFLVVFFWIKNKKCPWEILTCLVVAIGTSFWFVIYPNAMQVSTANANFFYESLAVFDGFFDTHLLEFVTTGVYGKEKAITTVAGADGWGRSGLLGDAIALCFSSVSSFVFGYGAGKNYETLVHNVYIQLWVECGIIGVFLYVALIVVFAINFIKNIKNDNQIFLLTILSMFVLIIHNLGCLESYSFIYFVMLFAVLYKNSKKEKIEEAIEKEETAKVENSQEQTQNVQEEPQEEVVEVEKDKKPQRKKVQKKTSKPRLQENKQGEN